MSILDTKSLSYEQCDQSSMTILSSHLGPYVRDSLIESDIVTDVPDLPEITFIKNLRRETDGRYPGQSPIFELMPCVQGI